MRTSGAATENTLILATCVVAFAIVVFLFGGTSEFFWMLEQMLRGLAESVVQAVRNLFR